MIDTRIADVVKYIKDDWSENRLRFCLEALCWLDSMTCAVIMNATVPNPPLFILYPLWISGTIAYAWCAYSRGSFGMLITFVMLASMDVIGYLRILISS